MILPSEGPGRQVTKRRVRPVGVVADPQRLNPFAGTASGKEPASVEALAPDKRVQGFDEGIVSWHSWPGEVQLHTVQIGPLVEQASGELWAIGQLVMNEVQAPTLVGRNSTSIGRLVPVVRLRPHRAKPLPWFEESGEKGT